MNLCYQLGFSGHERPSNGGTTPFLEKLPFRNRSLEHPRSPRHPCYKRTNKRVILSGALWRVCGEREVEGSPISGSPLTDGYREWLHHLKNFPAKAGRCRRSGFNAAVNPRWFDFSKRADSGSGEAQEENLILLAHSPATTCPVHRRLGDPSTALRARKEPRALRFAQDDPLFSLQNILHAGASMPACFRLK